MQTPLASLKALTITLVLFGTATLLNSQVGDEEEAVVIDEAIAITLPVPGEDLGKTPAERLATLRAINAQLLKKQEQTLQKLEKLEKEAEQLRIFARRS